MPKHRTESKVRFAEIHLEELTQYSMATSNDEWENAHQESVIYHLYGAVDAFLHEINQGYDLGLEVHEVKYKSVEKQLKKSRQSSPAFDFLKSIWEDDWLPLLRVWRNCGAHRQKVGKIVKVSTWRKIDNQFKDPRTNEVPDTFPDLGCMDVLSELIARVRNLIDECRKIDPQLRE